MKTAINNDNIKSFRLYIFALITLVLFLWVFFSRNSDFVNNSYTRQDFIEDVKLHEVEYLAIVDLLRKNIDTSFFAEYRMKQNQFYFYYLDKENKLINFFDSTGSIDNTLSKAKELRVREIIKNNNENFFRLRMVKNKNMKPQILISKKPGDAIVIQGGTDISKATILSDLQEVNHYESNPLLCKIKDDLWIYFPF